MSPDCKTNNGVLRPDAHQYAMLVSHIAVITRHMQSLYVKSGNSTPLRNSIQYRAGQRPSISRCLV
eukprot:3829777-Pyramimonas_sp.AAC.1